MAGDQRKQGSGRRPPDRAAPVNGESRPQYSQNLHYDDTRDGICANSLYGSLHPAHNMDLLHRSDAIPTLVWLVVVLLGVLPTTSEPRPSAWCPGSRYCREVGSRGIFQLRQ